MEFLSEYYLWFIIGGIILVMAVIGYIADKTDFGRKNKIVAESNKLKESKENNDSTTETPNVVVEEVFLQEPIMSDAVETIESINDVTNEIEVPIIEETKIEEPVIDNSNVIIDEQTIDESLENIKIEENNIEQPAINDISINNEEKIEIQEVVDDSAYVLNNDLSSFAAGAEDKNSPVSNVVEEVINDQNNDDDIWKF